MSGNAWVPNERGNRDGAQHGRPQDQHTPVRGFNAQEAKDTLRKGRLAFSDVQLDWSHLTWQKGIAA